MEIGRPKTLELLNSGQAKPTSYKALVRQIRVQEERKTKERGQSRRSVDEERVSGTSICMLRVGRLHTSTNLETNGAGKHKTAFASGECILHRNREFLKYSICTRLRCDPRGRRPRSEGWYSVHRAQSWGKLNSLALFPVSLTCNTVQTYPWLTLMDLRIQTFQKPGRFLAKGTDGGSMLTLRAKEANQT